MEQNIQPTPDDVSYRKDLITVYFSINDFYEPKGGYDYECVDWWTSTFGESPFLDEVLDAVLREDMEAIVKIAKEHSHLTHDKFTELSIVWDLFEGSTSSLHVSLVSEYTRGWIKVS